VTTKSSSAQKGQKCCGQWSMAKMMMASSRPAFGKGNGGEKIAKGDRCNEI